MVICFRVFTKQGLHLTPWIGWNPTMELPRPSAVVTAAPSSEPTGHRHELRLTTRVVPAAARPRYCRTSCSALAL